MSILHWPARSTWFTFKGSNTCVYVNMSGHLYVDSVALISRRVSWIDEFVILDPWLYDFSKKWGGGSYFGFRYSHYLRFLWTVLYVCFFFFLCKGTLILAVVSLCPQKHTWKYIEQMYYTGYHLCSISDSQALTSISNNCFINKDVSQLPPPPRWNLTAPWTSHFLPFRVLRLMGNYLVLIHVQTRVWEG